MGRKLTQEEAINRCNKCGIRMIGKYIGCKKKTLFECPYCGKEFLSAIANVWYKKIVSCGCYNRKITSERRSSNLIGKHFDKLEVISDTGKILRGYKLWHCKCKCGRFHDIPTNNLTSHNTKSCGHCGHNRNRVATSFAALQVHSMIDSDESFSEHNYEVPECGFRVDIAIPSVKIAIEYDEWFYHGKHIDKDNTRYQKLLDNGWKVLQIKARNNLPLQQQIDKSLFDLIMTDTRQVIITLPGWGNGALYNHGR